MIPAFLLLLFLFVPALQAAAAPDARTVIETMRARQEERWADVENYTVTMALEDAMGMQTPVYYEKITIEGQTTFRRVPPPEYTKAVLTEAGFPPLEAEDLEAMADGYDMLGDALSTGGGDMPPMDMQGMTGGMADALRFGASADIGDGRAEAKDSLQDMAEFARRSRLVGTEAVPASALSDATRNAYLLVAEDLSDIELEQPEGDATFTLEKASIWIDTEEYVPLRLLMEGNVEADGQTRDLTIEKLDLDYRQVGPLYESFHQVYRLGGITAALSEKEQKELAKAKEEMEKAKQQMAGMPEAQREMVMKMMGSQMEKLEAMTAGGEITSTTDVVSIAVNEGPPTPYGPGELTVGGPAAAAYPGALTLAAEGGCGSPSLVAELAVEARLPSGAKASITLAGAGAYPEEAGQVEIAGAEGSVGLEGGPTLSIDGGSGTITVTERTATRIMGTFTALLSGTEDTDSGPRSVQFSASGTFDCGAPVGPDRSLRGSPIPANLFGGCQ